jgi:RNA polymerase sigma-70 factor (ECF subfamily)
MSTLLISEDERSALNKLGQLSSGERGSPVPTAPPAGGGPVRTTERTQQPGRNEDELPAGEASDRSLVHQFQEGSQAAATELYLRYANRVRALAHARCSTELAARLDADDIVQSVFRCFFQAARRGYYDVPAGEELWGILLVIALNKIRDARAFHTAAKRDVRLTSGGKDLEQAMKHLEHADASQAFLRIAIQEALDMLPAKHRRIVELRMDGFEIAQIAQETGRSRRSVERVLQETRKKLDTYFS